MGGITAVVHLGDGRPGDKAALTIGEAEAYRGIPSVHEADGCSLVARRWSGEEEPIAAEAGVVAAVHGYFFGADYPTSARRLLDRYLERGEGAFTDLDGEFAFLLWDGRARTLFLGRDTFGTRPMYVCRVGEKIAVGTEIRQVQRAGLVKPQLEFDYLWPLLESGSTAGRPSETPFHGIHRVLPAQVRKISANTDRTWDMWRPPRAIDDALTPRALPGLILEVMRRAIRRRRWTLPAFLMSGGLDSPFVAAATMTDQDTASRFQPEPTAFTHVVPGHPVDEGARALQVAEHLGLRLTALDLGSPDVTATLGALLDQCDHPLALPGIGLIACLQQSRAGGFQTLVGGIGGDTFWHFREFDVSPWDLTPARAVPHILGRLRHGAGRGWRSAAKEFRSLASDLSRSPTKHSTRTWDRRIDGLNEFVCGPYEAREQLAARFEVVFSDPFLDREMAELAFSTPPKHLQNPGDRKRLLAEAARLVLPDSFVSTWRPTQYSGYLLGLLHAQADRLPVHPGTVLAHAAEHSRQALAGEGIDGVWRDEAAYLRFLALALWFKKSDNSTV